MEFKQIQKKMRDMKMKITKMNMVIKPIQKINKKINNNLTIIITIISQMTKIEKQYNKFKKRKVFFIIQNKQILLLKLLLDMKMAYAL